GEVLYELVKTAISKLELRLDDIVAECFEGAANMSGARKGLAARMKECSPLSIYVHCHGHRLNLALQDTMTTIEPLQKALGVIQSLHNFLEGSPQRHAIFKDIEVDDDDDDVTLTIKLQSATRWSCRWAAAKAVVNQFPRIIEALLSLSKDRDPKTYNDSNALINSICDFRFVFGLMKSVDGVIKTLSGCSTQDNFDLLWSRAEIIADEIKQLIKDTDFNFEDAKVPRLRQPSRRLQALVGEIPQVNAEVEYRAAEDHYRIICYYLSINKIVAEMKYRFEANDQEVLLALADIVFSSSPTRANIELVSDLHGIDSELFGSEKNVFESIDADYPDPERKNVAKIVRKMFENGVHEVPPAVYKVFSILATIPATSCSAERS
ncbi:Zinc finger MYM-type 1, partial [Paramuricea clavata]